MKYSDLIKLTRKQQELSKQYEGKKLIDKSPIDDWSAPISFVKTEEHNILEKRIKITFAGKCLGITLGQSVSFGLANLQDLSGLENHLPAARCISKRRRPKR